MQNILAALEGKAAGGSNEDVTDETNTYTSLLTDLETAIDALPDAGSGGDGSGAVETCTLNITSDDSKCCFDIISVQTYANGVYTQQIVGDLSKNKVIENVVNHSVVSLLFYYRSGASYSQALEQGVSSTLTNVVYLNEKALTVDRTYTCVAFEINSSAGGVASIDVVSGF